MAAILPFPVRHTGDWSASERARLDELAARFADQSGVEVAFGRSDSGDPWCVVLDAHDEVLVHIAREQGDVVVHAAAPDMFVRAPDLRTAVERVLGSRWLEERADVVVPFVSGSRAMQVVTAVLIVGSFAEHHRAEAEPIDDWVFAPRPPKPLARDGQRDDSAKVALVADAGPPAERASAVVDPASRATEPLPLGTASDPLFGVESGVAAAPRRELATWSIAEPPAVAGDATADVIVGTPGDDRLDGRRAPPGMHDLLDAGGGDDRLVLDGGTIAIGGGGADRFLLRAPDIATVGELALLGIVVDFEAGVDVLTAVNAPSFTIIASAPTSNIFIDPNVNLGALPETPGQQLFADLDGDGRADGYVLVNSAEPSPALLDAVRRAVAPAAEPPAPIVEQPALSPLVEFAAEPTAQPTATTAPPEPVAEAVPSQPPVRTAAEPVAEPAVTAPNVEAAAVAAAEPARPEAKVEPSNERPAEPAVSEPKVEPTEEPALSTVLAEPADAPSTLVSLFESPVESALPAPMIEVI